MVYRNTALKIFLKIPRKYPVWRVFPESLLKCLQFSFKTYKFVGNVEPYPGNTSPSLHLKKVSQKILENSQETTCARVPFFSKAAGCGLQLFWPATLLRKRLMPMCFPVNFAKFLKAPEKNLQITTSNLQNYQH